MAGEIALARRLQTEARAGVADPDFVAGLRQELQQRSLDGGERSAALAYATLETPVGRLAVAHRQGRVVQCTCLDWRSRASGDGTERAEQSFALGVAAAFGTQPRRAAALPAAIERGVLDHLSGRRRFTAVDLSWLTPFQQRVLAKTAEVPRGEVRPYGWVAREIGAPGAVRAVGTALGHNPIPFLVPCHRIVRSDGSLGEYSGGGPAIKERVLALEGVPVDELQRAAARGERYRASRTTHIVCYPSCHAARRIRPENAISLASLRQARAAGYRPCERCRPF